MKEIYNRSEESLLDTQVFDRHSPWEIPSDFSEWISEPVFGAGARNVSYLYRIYKTMGGQYALQEKRREIKIRPYNPVEYEVVAMGDLDAVFVKHMEFTEKPPVLC